MAIPEHLFRASAELARRLGVSRTMLYWRAIEEFLERHQADVLPLAADGPAADPRTPPDPDHFGMQRKKPTP